MDLIWKYGQLIKNLDDNEEFLEIMEKLIYSGLSHDELLEFLELETKSLKYFEDDLEKYVSNRNLIERRCIDTRKYELDKDDSIEVDNHTLYRVIYTDEFIKKYEEKYGFTIKKKGGYIESEKNLSQEGYAVVIDDAKVQDYAKITDDAKVSGTAIIENNAIVGGKAIVENIRLPL